jgi:DNA polymerase III subunit epsilon
MAVAPPIPDARVARQNACRWATQHARRPDTLYLDTETTGLDGAAEIIEIAVIDGAGRTLLDTLVRPDGHIPADASRIHGLLDCHVAGAPRWDSVYPRVQALLAGRPVIVYNAAFDLRLVNQMNARCGFPRVPEIWHCAMLRYADFAGVWHARHGNFRWHTLEAALRAFGQPASGHRAAGDARACRLVTQGMAALDSPGRECEDET